MTSTPGLRQRRATPNTTRLAVGEWPDPLNGPEKRLYEIRPYTIHEESRPAQHLPLHSFQGILAHLALVLGWTWYLFTRIRSCLLLSPRTASACWYEWLILACEVLQACPDFLQLLEITATFAAYGQPRRPSLKIRGDAAPMVHVLVTTCGENPDVIMDTVTAAAIQDYPRDCYRVFVLDDFRDDAIRSAVDELNDRILSAGYQSVVHLSRDKKPGIPHYYKSGNIQFGLQVKRDLYGNSEFFAALDADMVPEADWLARTVPHLIQSPNLALCSPPQLSYNIPDGDELGQDSNVFGRVMEPIRDSFGCSQCSGSGYVMRRKALDSIGGWPLTNMGEDIVCSYMLEQAGWEAAYIEDELQFGMAPGSLHAYAVQRVRWTAGSLLIARKFKFFLPFLNRTSLSTAQRLFGMHHAFKTYFNAALVIPLLLWPVLLPLASLNEFDNRLRRPELRQSYLLLWVASKAWKYLAFGHVGTRNLSNISRNRYWVVPYHVYALIQSFTIDLEDTPFTVSGTIKSPVDERSPTHRQPLVHRMLNPLVLMHTLYWIIACLAFITTVATIGFQKTSSASPLSGSNDSYLRTGAMLRLLEIVFATATPVRYMLFPPTVLARREYLEKNEKTGVYRSIRKTWTKRDGGVVSWKDIIEAVTILGCDWL